MALIDLRARAWGRVEAVRGRKYRNHPGHDQKSHGRKGGGLKKSDDDSVFTDEELGAFAAYKEFGPTVEEVNTGLRNGDLSPELMEEVVLPLDSAMAKSRLTEDTELDRGLFEVEDVFPGGAGRDLTGEEWTEPAFSSTTRDRNEAESFAYGGQNPAVLRITARAGTPAVDMYGQEEEILLARGLTFKVTADRGVDVGGGYNGSDVRRLDVEVSAP